MDVLLQTVALNFQWASPEYIDRMYCDKKDHHGLLYWYEVAQQEQERIKAASQVPPSK